MTSSRPRRNWPEWPATLSSPSASANPVSHRMCSGRTPKYASMPAPDRRSRSAARRWGRCARSASVHRRRVAASGGGAKSAGTGNARMDPAVTSVVAVLAELLLVLVERLAEVVRPLALRDRDEELEPARRVRLERRVDGRDRRVGDGSRREAAVLVRVVPVERLGQLLIPQASALGHRPEHVLRPS